MLFRSEQNPPDEFALRNNTSALGQVGFEGSAIVDDVVEDTGTISVEMLLKTLFRGIESTFLNPLNANNLWERMRNSIVQNSVQYYSSCHTNCAPKLN